MARHFRCRVGHTGRRLEGGPSSPPFRPLPTALSLRALFHHGSGRHLFGSFSIATRTLSFGLDMFVLTLLFAAGTSQVLASWHAGSPFKNQVLAPALCGARY